MPLIQAWTPIRNETSDRCFIAEIRWWETKPGGELRFGVDFEPRPDKKEDEEVRSAAYDLATRMSENIDFHALKSQLNQSAPQVATLLDRKKNSRPEASGDWEEIIRFGFAGASPLNDGGKLKKKNRKNTHPAFYGDGALRFQAIADVDFTQATAQDLSLILKVTLEYLSQAEPSIGTNTAV